MAIFKKSVPIYSWKDIASLIVTLKFHCGFDFMILVTGGAGYIGSHTVLLLLENGFDVVVLDNLCNSSIESLNRVKKITGRAVEFVYGDVGDAVLLQGLFARYPVNSVLHFAGLKSVSESIAHPLHYYENNVQGSLILLQQMAKASIFKFVFSSSATVYGEGAQMPVSESCPVVKPSNPYGRTKLIVEKIIYDLAAADSRWCSAILRYFNPVGAHESALIGEDPSGIPSNLLPYIAQVAVGKLSELQIFGGDYPTLDGTGVRDYIHVMDLANGHLHALNAIKNRTGAHVWNLGTGQGYSVLEILRAFEVASGCSVPYRITKRRPGDIGVCYADPSKAKGELGWRAERALSVMMSDAWRWQINNPNGYKSVNEG